MNIHTVSSQSIMVRGARFFIVAALVFFCTASQALAWDETTLFPLKEDNKKEYVVQAARFSEEKDALALQQKLGKEGYKPYLFVNAGADGVRWHAVRLDVFNNMDQALTLARKLKREAKVNAVITDPGSTESLFEKPIVFFLQVNAFKSKQNALNNAKTFTDLGYSAHVLNLMEKEIPWFVVYIGWYDSLQKARTAMGDFSKKRTEKCYINMIDKELFAQRMVKQ